MKTVTTFLRGQAITARQAIKTLKREVNERKDTQTFDVLLGFMLEASHCADECVERSWEELRCGAIDDVEHRGWALAELCWSLAEALSEMAILIQQTSEKGRSVKRSEQITPARTKLLQRRDELLAVWPKSDPQSSPPDGEDHEEQKRTWEALKGILDESRTSNRKLFS